MRVDGKTVLILCLTLAACSEDNSGVSIPGVTGPGGTDSDQNPINETPGGDGDGDGDGDNQNNVGGDGDECLPTVVTSARVKPDMLIVLDRSGSMDENNRWNASVSALKAVTDQLDAAIRFGLLAFPGAAMADPNAPPPSSDPCDGLSGWELLTCQLTGGFVNPGQWTGGDQCQAGSIAVDIGDDNGPAISAALDAMRPNGSTPTAASLREAKNVLGSGLAGPDEMVTPKFVLLVTDGEPRCGDSTGGDRGDAAAIADSVAAVGELADAGIKTYVIGYNTQGQAKGVMDMLAQAGGTGSTEHIPVENEAGLVAALEDITGRAISCTFVLEQAPGDPSFVSVEVDGEAIRYNDPNGWVLSDDRLQVLIQGESCDTLRSSGDHTLSVDVLCEQVIF